MIWEWLSLFLTASQADAIEISPNGQNLTAPPPGSP